MNDESLSNNGFNTFKTFETYIDELDDDDIVTEIVWRGLSSHIPSENMRQTDIQGLISQIEETKIAESGVEWLGNPFVLCTGGIYRSPATINFLRPRLGEDQKIINDSLPKTSSEGFVASDIEKLKEYLFRSGDKLLTTKDQRELDTIVFHISPQDDDFNPLVSLTFLMNLLDELNPSEDRLPLTTKLLLVVDTEKTVRDAYESV